MSRRLSLRQAIRCELGQTLATQSRCRCRGQLRNARRVADVNRPTRWDFARLPVDDPHYIPAQRRRISPRRAVQVIADAIKRQGKSPRLNTAIAKLRQRDPAAAAAMLSALSQANAVVRDERRRAVRRTRLWQLNHDQFDADVFASSVQQRLYDFTHFEAAAQ